MNMNGVSVFQICNANDGDRLCPPFLYTYQSDEMSLQGTAHGFEKAPGTGSSGPETSERMGKGVRALRA